MDERTKEWIKKCLEEGHQSALKRLADPNAQAEYKKRISQIEMRTALYCARIEKGMALTINYLRYQTYVG